MLDPRKSRPIEAKVVCRADDQIPEFLRTKTYDMRYVKDALEKELQHWNSRNPVLINAPTGKGKNTFIEDVVIPHFLASGKNIVIVSNRSALVVQEKLRIMKKYTCYDKDMWTKKRIRLEENIHSQIVVITYHSLGRFLSDPKNKEWLKNVAVVVADEVHFLTSDSSFNDMCGYYLKLLTTEFRHCIRIYMTATVWDVIVPLAEAEEKAQEFRAPQHDFRLPRTFYHYRFTASYNHINLEFFDDVSEITSMVENNPDDKIIVFVDNKEVGKALATEFGKKAIFIDRDKKDTTEWHMLLDSEDEMPCQILICTQVFDCGINFKDRRLKHIYVITDDRTTLLQEIGRKRYTDGERFTVHVMNLNKEKFNMRYKNAANLLQWEVRYDNADDETRLRMAVELWNDGTDQLRTYFKLNVGRNGVYLFKNDLAFHKLHRTMAFYDKLRTGEITFQNAVRSWLGKEIIDEDDYIEVLTQYLENNTGREIVEEYRDDFRALVRSAYTQSGFKEEQPSRDIQYNAINNRLKNMKVAFALTKEWKVEKVRNCDKEE